MPAECIRILHWDNDLVDIEEPTFSLGAESSQLLRDIQHVESRPGSLPIVQALQRYLQLVNEDKWDSEEALALRETLDRWSQEENLRWSGRIWISGCVISAGRNKKL